MNPKTWTQSEFMSFLLLYGSRVDARIAPEEINFIIDHFGDEAYQKIIPLLEQQSDYENVQTILMYKEKFFPGASGKEYILKSLKELFIVDQQFHVVERAVLNVLNRLF